MTRNAWNGSCSRFRKKRALVQSFMPQILTEGEYSLFFFNGSSVTQS